MVETTKEVKIKLSKRKIMLTIFLIIIIVAISFLISAFKTIFRDRKISNLGNMGLAKEYEKVIYYNKWEDGIYKVKGNKETKLIDETAYSINVVDDVIYYITVSKDNEILLKSLDIDGKNSKVLKRLYTSVSKIYVQDGFIYFVTNEAADGISKYNIETGEATMITTSPIKDFVVTEDKVYFSDNINNLYEMSLTGIELKRVIAKPMVEMFAIYDDHIYFYNTIDNNFVRTDLNGENLEVITTRIVANANYNVTRNKIYFFDKETNSISSMNLKGENIEIVKEINAKKTKINIVGDQIYYLDSSIDPKQSYQIHRVFLNGKEGKEIKY